METITFEIHHITPTSPRNTLATILKAFWFFCFSCSLHILLLSIKRHIIYGHIRERKEKPIYVCQTSFSCYEVLHLTEHGFYELHIDVVWLTSFSGEMVIYAFSLIIFLVLPLKKSDKVMNDKRLTKSYKSHNEPQSSHCSIVHKDTHLSYERYKIKKPCSKGLPKVHKYQYTQTHTIFVFFRFFPPFFYLK